MDKSNEYYAQGPHVLALPSRRGHWSEMDLACALAVSSMKEAQAVSRFHIVPLHSGCPDDYVGGSLDLAFRLTS